MLPFTTLITLFGCQNNSSCIDKVVYRLITTQLKKTNVMAPFYGWVTTATRLEPLRGGSLLFTISPQKFLVLTLSTSEG